MANAARLMTNDECQRTNEARITKSEALEEYGCRFQFVILASDFFRHSSLDNSEAHLHRFLLLRLLDDEQFRRTEVERPRDHVRRERFSLRVVPHYRVVIGLAGE